MNLSVSIFRIRGIEVRVHVTFVLILVLGALLWSRHGASGALFGATMMLLVFGCVLLHELGHSFVAQRLGLTVPRIVLYPLGGIAAIGGTPSKPIHEAAIAAAGPAVSLVLAACFGGLLAVRGELNALGSLALPAHLPPGPETVLIGLFGANALLAAFNLLPFFPLDGGRILRALLAARVGQRRGTEWAASVGQVGAFGLLAWAVLSVQLFLGAVAVFLILGATQEKQSMRVQSVLRVLRAEDIAELPTAELARGTTVADAARVLLRTGQRVLPIVDGERVLALVSRDALLRAAPGAAASRESVMTLAERPLFVDAEVSADAALSLLAASDAPAAVVMRGAVPLGLIGLREVNERAEPFAALQLPSTPAPGGPLARPNVQSRP